MMEIFIDRLKDGEKQQIKEELPLDFFDIDEEDLRVKAPAYVEAEAHSTDEHLVICFSAKAEFILPCSLCNGDATIDIEIKESYHTEELSSIPLRVFDLSSHVRETILLEIPAFAECRGGSCSKREEVSKYLSEPEKKNKPFSELLN